MEKRSPDDSYRHVLKYTGVFGGVQGLKMFVSLLRNKLTAKLLGEAGMGLNKRFINVSEVINAWTNFGISFYAVQRISEIYEEGTEDDMHRFVGVIRTWSVWSAILGGLLCFFLASWLNGYYFPMGEQHSLEIKLLSLFVASLPIEAVECAILKGLRRLRTVALIEVCSAFSTLLFTIPVYYFFGFRGIVASLVLCGWATALIHLFFSVRIYRYRVQLFSHSVLREGWPLVRIGIPYVLAGVVGAMAAGEVYKRLGSDSVIGLYGVGYSLVVTYAGMVFKALETDFFPRLSSINHDTPRLNHAINQQIDICVLLITPIMIVFAMFMPQFISLLYDSRFLPAVPMSQCAVFYMFFKAITTPIAYTSLAKGDSWLYLIMETVYDVVFVLMIGVSYGLWGLTGTGIALSASALFDLLMIGGVYAMCYHFRMRAKTLLHIIPQGILLVFVMLASLFAFWPIKILVGTICLALSLILSWRLLSPELPIVQKIKRRLGMKD